MIRKWYSLFVIAAAGTLAAPSMAAVFNYGTFPAGKVSFVNVVESSGNDPNALYAPTAASNSLNFDPVGFSASSQAGGNALRTGTLALNIHAAANSAFSHITFSDSGDLSVIGSGTNSTFVDVGGSGIITIFEVDGISITPLQIPYSLTFSPQADGMWELGTDGTAFAQAWSGQRSVDLNAALTNQAIPFSRGTTRAGLQLDNTLIVASQATSIASIEKKDVVIGATAFTVGDSAAHLLLPDSVGPNGQFVFNVEPGDLPVGGNGAWFDPPIATGYRYQITGGTFIGTAPPDDPGIVNDDDNAYQLISANGAFPLNPTLGFPASEHSFVANGGAVTDFTISGISVGGAGVDAANPNAFPTFLRLGPLSGPATITMTPVPEPFSCLVALVGIMCGCLRWRSVRAK